MASPNPRQRRRDEDTVKRNDQIRAREVRLIGAESEQMGIVERNEALRLAEEAGLDLVEVAPSATPPVCRIMDYGKYRYEEQKKKQEARKRQTVVEVKEIKLRPKTDEHDYQTKLRHIRRFIEDDARCKVTIFFRGREIVHRDRGQDMLDRVAHDTADIARVDQAARSEGRTLFMMIGPLKE